MVRTGARLIKHARYYWLAESHLTRWLFAGMLGRNRGATVTSRLGVVGVKLQSGRIKEEMGSVCARRPRMRRRRGLAHSKWRNRPLALHSFGQNRSKAGRLRYKTVGRYKS